MKNFKKYLTKYTDHFGEVPCMGIENLGFSSMVLNDRDRAYSVGFAARYYYYMRDSSLEDSLNEAGIDADITMDELYELVLRVKKLFTEDSYYHHVMKKNQTKSETHNLQKS